MESPESSPDGARRSPSGLLRKSCPAVIPQGSGLPVFLGFLPHRRVKSRVKGLKVLAVHLLNGVPEGFTEPLEVDDLPLPEEADGVTDFRIVDGAQNVVVGGAGFLFRSQVFKQVRNGIPFALEFAGVKGDTACRLRSYTDGVVNVVGAEAGGLNLLHGEVAGQLPDNGGHNLHVPQFFGADVCERSAGHLEGHGVPLGEIAHGSADLAVRAPSLPSAITSFRLHKSFKMFSFVIILFASVLYLMAIL